MKPSDSDNPVGCWPAPNHKRQWDSQKVMQTWKEKNIYKGQFGIEHTIANSP